MKKYLFFLTTAVIFMCLPIFAYGVLTSGVTVSMSANATSVPYGGSVRLAWVGVNATSCAASGSGWSGAKAPSGAETISNLNTPGIVSFSLTCSNATSAGTKTINVRVLESSSLITLPNPVNGVCGTANKQYPSTSTSFGADTFCSAGSLSQTPAFPAPGGSVSWACMGSNGGTSSSCSASRVNAPTPVNGVCGTANKQYPSTSTSFGTDTFCTTGTFLSQQNPLIFPSPGGDVSWTCAGSNGGTSAVCYARVLTTTTCTSFTYSAWSPNVCPASQTQTRTKITSLPAGCTGGNPILSQTCTCEPQCSGKACGADDLCGHKCDGSCPTDQTCDSTTKTCVSTFNCPSPKKVCGTGTNKICCGAYEYCAGTDTSPSCCASNVITNPSGVKECCNTPTTPCGSIPGLQACCNWNTDQCYFKMTSDVPSLTQGLCCPTKVSTTDPTKNSTLCDMFGMYQTCCGPNRSCRYLLNSATCCATDEQVCGNRGYQICCKKADVCAGSATSPRCCKTVVVKTSGAKECCETPKTVCGTYAGMQDCCATTASCYMKEIDSTTMPGGSIYGACCPTKVSTTDPTKNSKICSLAGVNHQACCSASQECLYQVFDVGCCDGKTCGPKTSIQACCSKDVECSVNNEEGNKCCKAQEKSCGAEGYQICCKQGEECIGQTSTVPKCQMWGEVNLYLNPFYITATETNRLFTPVYPVNPYDGLTLELKIKKAESPQSLGFNGSLILPGSSATINLGGFMSWNVVRSKADPNYDYYTWNSPSFPNSFASSESALDTLVAVGKVQGLVEDDAGGLIFTETSNVLDVTSCVHMWGDEDLAEAGTKGYSVVVVGGQNVPNGTTFDNAKKTYEQALWVYDPFKKYPRNFEIYADVKKYNEGEPADNTTTSGALMLTNIRKNSKCPGKDVYYLYTDKFNKFTKIFGGVYSPASKSILIPYVSLDDIDSIPYVSIDDTDTIIHELAHYFTVRDEYPFVVSESPNCSTTSLLHPIDGCAKFKSLFTNYSDGCYKQCGSTAKYFRSSIESLMNLPGPHKFNKLTCAVILNEIFPTRIRSENWTRCVQTDMSTQVKDECGINTTVGYNTSCSTNSLDLPYNYDVVRCGRCSNGKCVSASNPNYDCVATNKSGQKVFGSCLPPESISNDTGAFSCNIDILWKCNSQGGCKTTEVCNLTTHQCVLK